MAEYIYVKAAKQDRRMVIGEIDDAHPVNENGERSIWIAGDERVYKVGQSQGVLAALADKRLVQVDKPATEAGNNSDDTKSPADKRR